MHAIPNTCGDRCDQFVHRLFLSVERTDGEHQCKDEQADAVAHDVVAQQDGGDDSRRQLAACYLNRHQQLAEREHQKRQCQRDDGLIQSGRAGRCELGELPALPVIERMDHRREHQLERDGDERDRPQRGLEIAGRAVTPGPTSPCSEGSSGTGASARPTSIQGWHFRAGRESSLYSGRVSTAIWARYRIRTSRRSCRRRPDHSIPG